MLADWVCIIFTLDWVRDSCGTDTQKALAWIARLYDTEGGHQGFPPDQKAAVRQQRAGPLLESFRAWLSCFPLLSVCNQSAAATPAIAPMALDEVPHPHQ